MSHQILRKLAFPIVRTNNTGNTEVLSVGMTKREYYAGQIMQTLVPANRAIGESPDNLASKAVMYADALINALEITNATAVKENMPQEGYHRGFCQ